MNVRREAILWSIAIAAAIALGLVVIWAALVLAFGRPNLAPLYFAAAPYRQDDYSAEGVDVARLNPLDPGLEQEAILEDQARSGLVLNVNYNLEVAGQVAPSVALPAPMNTPLPVSTNTSVPAPANTPLPMPTNTSAPASTNTPLPMLTNTSAPTNLPTPTSTNTPLPMPTNTSAPAPTNTPTSTNTPLPMPTNTSAPAPTNTSIAPNPTKVPKPTHIPNPTHVPGPTHVPRPTHVSKLPESMPTNTSVPAPTLILRQAECLADSVIFMYLGELIELGPANEIFNSPREERTREYLAGAIGTCSQPASDQLPLVTGE